MNLRYVLYELIVGMVTPTLSLDVLVQTVSRYVKRVKENVQRPTEIELILTVSAGYL
jgi:hypothetical protein